MESAAVRVVAPNPAWPQAFDQEAQALKKVLGHHAVYIHHIGSTAVADLWAKPIIDMLPVVDDVAALDQLAVGLQELGYEGLGEFGLPGRRYFRKNQGIRTHQVHCYAVGDPAIYRHLAFRDYLRVSPETRDAYGALKQKLAGRHAHSWESYMDGKDAFVKAVEQKALDWWGVVPLLFITGPVGVGKTSVAHAISAVLDLPSWLMDVDRLTDLVPPPPGDRFQEGIARQGVARLWPLYRSAGARLVIIPRVLEHPDELAAWAGVIPGGVPYVIRLRAERETLADRLAGREQGEALAWHLRRAAELGPALDAGNLGDLVLNTDHIPVQEIADVVAAAVRTRFAGLWGPQR
jgi:GrpB-like predicted nucleotidyltransferase (UPF0157 family)